MQVNDQVSTDGDIVVPNSSEKWPFTVLCKEYFTPYLIVSTCYAMRQDTDGEGKCSSSPG